ncbi:hypothetical protein [Mycobacterium sp. 1274761.0]|uniref:hypothetical protein n=1 Tax=Mycobacterium sp. 1274761.0 TaxID=1834077 RepID=UPI0008000E8E|nr:hypothetical protein [Mycobacterium sp. 1274761.0]OBK77413.1 hypothetical protein A5651_04340 [Mycobacterium sp. 1274761.0]
MFFAAVGCLCAALATAALGGWTLSRPCSADMVAQVLRAVAPTQLAAAAMLAVAGVVALSTQPDTGVVVLIVCVIGAVTTVAAGCWQSAKFVAAREGAACGSAASGCGTGACATCALSRG